ncbi:MAG: nicotinate-nucleotide--dimethylbenzimidazole phosphoribosyltransferase [bacterium]
MSGSQSDRVAADIRDYWDSLVKPPGSLGDLEEWVTRLGRIQETDRPEIDPACLLLFAGDHGVARENVSAYPQSVTAAMLQTIQEGGAAINSLCEEVGLNLEWYNLGARNGPTRDDERIGHGTENMLHGPALSDEHLWKALEAGRLALRKRLENGLKLVALGEIGIGNTTASSAMAGAILDCSVEDVVGPGTGVEGDQLNHKKEIVKTVLDRRDPDPDDGFQVLQSVGGYEIAAQVGVILEASDRNVPVLLDGFITGAAALASSRIDPAVKQVLVATHVSAEPAHRRVLDALGLTPMIDLNLRLGEGSGAALAYPLLKSALAAYRGMQTFEDAGLNGAGS